MARIADPDYTFDVLVTSTERDLLTQVTRAMAIPPGLPSYDSGLRWIVARDCEITSSRPFDLSLVVCGAAEQMNAAMRLAGDLARQCQPVVLLAPAPVIRPDHQLGGVLVVGAPATSVVDNLILLAHTILAPSLATNVAAADWSDVLTVLKEGSQAVIAMGRSRTAEEAIAALSSELKQMAPSEWSGACGALSSPSGESFSSFHRLLNWMDSRCLSTAYVLLALLEHNEGSDGVMACLLVNTRCSKGLEIRTGRLRAKTRGA